MAEGRVEGDGEREAYVWTGTENQALSGRADLQGGEEKEKTCTFLVCHSFT